MKSLLFKKRSQPAEPRPMPSLALCIVMDLLGFATLGVPILGEFLDVLWAPLSAAIYMRMFGGVKGMVGGAFNFLEEILPFTDIIPTFTITWFIQYSRRKKNTYTIYPVSR
ncbi:MAG TPA: hypothetical protein VGB46_09245 [Flavisolibacter sp.]